MQPWHNNGCIVGAWFENHCCDGWNDFLAVAPAYSKSMLHVQQSHIGWSRWWHTVLAGCSWVKKQQWLQNHTWWFTALSKLVIYNPNIPQVYVYIYSWAKPTYSTYNLNNMTPGINCSELRWASGCRTFSWLEPETRSFLIPEKHCGRIWKWGIPLIYGHFKREYDDHPWNFGVTDFQKKNMYIEPVFLKIQTEDPDRRACFSRCEPTRRKGTMIFEIHTCIYIYT